MKPFAVPRDIALFALLAIFFIWRSDVDLAVSAWFYRPGEGFFLHDAPWADFVFHFAPLQTNLFAVGLGIALLLSWVPFCTSLRKGRRGLIYLALVLGMGPGLLVNTVLKDHWGRARPSHVREFGGTMTFTPAFKMTDQCRRNCSFVSGHASLGFYYCAIAFLDRRRRRFWFGLGLLLGGLIGYARIAQGRHFLSDVVFSFFAVYFCAKFLHYLILGSKSPLHRLLNRGSENPEQAGGLCSEQRL